MPRCSIPAVSSKLPVGKEYRLPAAHEIAAEPWIVVRTAIDLAFRMNVLVRAEASGAWPCDLAGAGAVTIRLPLDARDAGTVTRTGSGTTGGSAPTPNTRRSPELVLKPNELQDLTDLIPDLLRATTGHELTFEISIGLKGEARPNDQIVKSINDLPKQVRGGLQVV